MSEIVIAEGYSPGVIGDVTSLHARYYHEHWGFGAHFEATVAKGLAEFLQRYEPDRDGFWTASAGGRIVGSVANRRQGRRVGRGTPAVVLRLGRPPGPGSGRPAARDGEGLLPRQGLPPNTPVDVSGPGRCEAPVRARGVCARRGVPGLAVGDRGERAALGVRAPRRLTSVPRTGRVCSTGRWGRV